MKIVKWVVVIAFGLILTACGGSKEELPKFNVSAKTVEGGHVVIYNESVFSGYGTNVLIVPDQNYQVASVIGCGGRLKEGNLYETGGIVADCVITPTFTPITFRVTVLTGPGGTITPAFADIAYNSYAKFTITADDGYHIKSILGCSGLLVKGAYTVGPVTQACTITPVFEVDTVASTTPVTITGVAAKGDALANATVTAKCTDGSGFLSKVVTNTQGKFSGTVAASVLPCALSVASGADQYYSIATTAGQTNITPLTSLILSLASQEITADWFAGTDWQSVVSQLQLAQTLIGAALKNAGYDLPDGDFLPLTATFQIGDDWDKVLDQLQNAIDSSNSVGSFDALIALIKDGNLGSLPAASGT